MRPQPIFMTRTSWTSGIGESVNTNVGATLTGLRLNRRRSAHKVRSSSWVIHSRRSCASSACTTTAPDAAAYKRGSAIK